jgi:amino acid adenylation domain-containing protein/non-ribosomal peptide synthase protein (TIGR01720 family)
MKQETIKGFQLSPQQKHLWLLQQDSIIPYLAQCIVQIDGNVNQEILNKSIENIVNRHEILRTYFDCLPGMEFPMQVITASSIPLINKHDFSHLDFHQQKIKIEKLFEEVGQQPLKFEQNSLLHLDLVELSTDKHILLFSLPVLCADKISLSNIVREISYSYAAYSNGEELFDEDERVQYADISEILNELITSEDTIAGREYWLKQDIYNCADLKFLFENTSNSKTQFLPKYFISLVNAELTAKIKAIASEYNSSTFGFILTCWLILVGRLTGKSDLIIGTAFDCRAYEGLEEALGLFAKYLPLQCELKDNLQFSELLQKVNALSCELPEWQEYFTWEQVNQKTNIQKIDLPFFPVCFEFAEQQEKYSIGNVSFSICKSYANIDKFKLKLVCVRRDDALILEFHYDSHVFLREEIQLLAERFETLLTSVVKNSTSAIAELDILSPIERSQLLFKFNNTKTAEPEYQCVHHWFESQVECTPDKIAVVYENQQLTYTHLNQRANQLAHHLQQLGVGPEVLVGICVERSLDMVVGVLGILKAGGAYVPIDPTYPKERLAFILEDTQAPVLLTQQRLLEILPKNGGEVICLDVDFEKFASTQTVSNPSSKTNSDNLAYIIYTSGSTGKPKGTLIHHKGLVNYLSWCTQAYKVNQGGGTIVHSPLGFDLTITSLFSPLLVGSQVELLPENNSIESLSNSLHRSSNLSLVKITPAHLELLKGQFSPQEAAGRTRAFIIGGENLLAENITFWQNAVPDTMLINEYGPTETVVGCCVYQVPTGQHHSGSIPIGKPIANTQLYVLDQHGQPAPIGVAGELHIGGAGLARGYLNRPDLSAEKFIPNAFSTKPGERLYKTGDLARYRLDGTLEYLRRIDDQVKIRGFRIELGEIEAVLSQAPGVQDSVVIVREDIPGKRRLVAYIVLNQELSSSINHLQVFLQQKLPDYMIPSAFVALQKLPLTPNGKIDRRALPAPDKVRSEATYVAPRTPVEEILATIWTQILGLEQVGIYDNFLEVGGDSILSIQVIAKAKQAGLQLTPQQIFDHPTIAELAQVVGSNLNIYAEQGLITGGLPLTPIQHWFFEQNLPDPHHWNQAVLLEVNQALDSVLLEKALQHLLEHHDALRLRFECSEAGWQSVNASLDNAIAFTLPDLSTQSPEQQKLAIELTATQLQASLNLSQGPLVQVALFDLGLQQPGRLLIIIHHLAVDGVSWRILLEDLQITYKQLSQGQKINLPAKTTSFKYWAEQLQEYANSASLQQELSYWLALPQQQQKITVDFLRGTNTEATKATVSVVLTVAETQALLQDVPVAYRTQINDVLLTALVHSFKQWTGQPSLLLDLEGHGREEILDHVDLTRTVGWFTTIFPVLLDIGNATNLTDAVQKVKEQLRGVPNRGFGYGVLRYLNNHSEITQKLQAQPQPEVIFNYLGQFDQLLPNLSLFSLGKEAIGATRSLRGNRRYLLEVEAMVINNQLQLQWSYSINLHHQNTVESLAQGMVKALRSLISYSQSTEVAAYTPVDFPDAEMSQAQLDQVFQELDLD